MSSLRSRRIIARDETIISDCSSDDEEKSHCNNISSHSSSSSSSADELSVSIPEVKRRPFVSLSGGQIKQRRRRNAWNNQHKTFQMSSPHHKFPPLSLSLSQRTPEDMRKSKTIPSGPRFGKSVADLKRPLSSLLTSPISQSVTITLDEFTTLSKSQKTTNLRYMKGGYFEEFLKSQDKQKMERRYLAHNERLGINIGIMVRIIAIKTSFDVRLAKVQELDENATIFHLILPPNEIHAEMVVGSNLIAYFDTEPLLLPNKELIYVQPHKIRLL